MTAPSITAPTTLMERVHAFDALGTHRTGTPGDDATTIWLLDLLWAAGVPGEAHHFQFAQLRAHTATVTVGAHTIQGHAHMDGGLTPADGVTGPLMPAATATLGSVGWVDLAADGGAGHGVEGVIDTAVARGLRALVVVGNRGAGSFFLANATRIGAPAPLPVLFIAPADAGPVQAALTTGTEVRVTIVGERAWQPGTNAVARIAADSPVSGLAPIGVMTPKSGWYTCAAERGGGIVIWLAVAEALAQTRGRTRDVILTATSGHELGHAGLEAYLLDHPEEAAEAAFWVHLGASIGAAVSPMLAVFANDSAMHDDLMAELARAGAGPYRDTPGLMPGGEARNIAGRGGRYVSLAGGHAYFHHPEDRPDKVDPESVARYADAVVALLLRHATARP